VLVLVVAALCLTGFVAWLILRGTPPATRLDGVAKIVAAWRRHDDAEPLEGDGTEVSE
jgi:hypothetical protein